MKKVTVMLSLILCLLFASPGIAEAPITVLINGSVLQTDVPPQIISGRTMVPIAAIAQGLGCSVDWNADAQQVSITSNETTPQLEDIAITGPDDFKKFINEVLGKMDSVSKAFVKQNLRQIVYEDPPLYHDSYAWSDMKSNGVCYIDAIYFRQAEQKLSKNELIYGYLGCIVHEANHFFLDKTKTDKLYSDKDQEALSDFIAMKAIAKAGGKSSACYNQFKKTFQSELDI